MLGARGARILLRKLPWNHSPIPISSLPVPQPAPITTTMRSEWQTEPAHDGAQRPPAFAACLRTSLGATLPLMKPGKASMFLSYFGVIMEIFPCE